MLEQNYRSTQTILSAANAVISQNSGRREKNLWTALGEGERIVGYVADNEHDEARFVAREIDQLVDNSAINYGDIAVFYRTNNASRALEDIFIRNGLSYKVVGGTRFYERKEIRDIIAYLKVLDNPDDSVSLRRIINTPRRGIGNRALSLLSLYAEDHGVSMGAALRAAADGDIPALGSRGNKAVGRFVEMMDGLREDTADNQLVSHDGDGLGIPDLGAIVNDVIERSGYLESLEDRMIRRMGPDWITSVSLSLWRVSSPPKLHISWLMNACLELPHRRVPRVLARRMVPASAVMASVAAAPIAAEELTLPQVTKHFLKKVNLSRGVCRHFWSVFP